MECTTNTRVVHIRRTDIIPYTDKRTRTGPERTDDSGTRRASGVVFDTVVVAYPLGIRMHDSGIPIYRRTPRVCVLRTRRPVKHEDTLNSTVFVEEKKNRRPSSCYRVRDVSTLPRLYVRVAGRV